MVTVQLSPYSSWCIMLKLCVGGAVDCTVHIVHANDTASQTSALRLHCAITVVELS